MSYPVATARGGKASARYWLLDRFTDDRAAGAINGTPAKPGPGDRVTVDTGSNMTINGGALINNGTSASAGTPAIWWGGKARVTGMALMFQATAGAGIYEAGFDTAQSGRPTAHAIRINALSLQISTGEATGAIFYVITSAQTYQLAIVTRGTGVWIFAKGNALTNWSLLWFTATGNSSPLFPTVYQNGAGGSDNWNIQNWRGVGFAIIPVPLAYDTFTRADGAIGSTEMLGPDNQALTALAWTLQAGTIAIVSNTASVTSAPAIGTVTAASADVLFEVNVTRSAGSGGVVLRYADSSNYVIARHDGTNAILDKVVAGSTTNVISAAATYAAAAPVRVRAIGSAFELFYNNARVGTGGTIADAALQSPTLIGLYGTDTSVVFDGFQVLAVGTGGEYNANLNVV